MRFALLSVFLLIFSSISHADFLEVLSQGSSRLWGAESCHYRADEKSLKAVQESQECLGANNSLNDLSETVTEARAIARQAARQSSVSVDKKSEDGFFASLALQHAKELDCTADFAKQISGEDAKAQEARADIANKLRILREAKQQLVSLSEQLAKDPNANPKICPLNAEDLKPNPIAVSVSGQDKGYELCRGILKTRSAVETVSHIIPLGGAPAIHDLMDKFSTAKGSEAEELDRNLETLIKNAYANSGESVKKSAKDLRADGINGGAKLDRATRHALLSDPLVINKVISSAGGEHKEVMTGLACNVDQRYGRGADDLNKTVLIGSVVLSTGAGLALRAGAYAARFAVGTQAVRGAGMISINAMRALEYSAVGLTAGVDAVAAYSQIDAACNLKPSQLASGSSDDGKSCVMAPSLEQLPQDSCVMAKALSVLNFTTTLIPTFLKGERLVQGTAVPRHSLAEAARLNPEERLQEASYVIARPLTKTEESAVKQAHEVGLGELGKDKINPAGITNYTNAQLFKKSDILMRAGFSQDERRRLVENGIVGSLGNASQFAAKAPPLPSKWPEQTQKEFNQALDKASLARAPMRPGGNTNSAKVKIEEMQSAVISQMGLKADAVPVISSESGGKVVMTYTNTYGKKVMVKMNATNGQYYYTIIERMDGRDTYMMLTPGSQGLRWNGLRPCKDMSQCHYNVIF